MSTKIITQENIFEQVRLISFPDIVNAFYGLQPGKDSKIICPFHEEKNPSFHVYEDRGKCYGCQWSGDGVAFVEKIEGIGPKKAAEQIAEKLQLPLNPTIPKQVASTPSDNNISYDYHDENGNIVYQVVRTWDYKNNKKSFFIRRPNGDGEYIKGLGEAKKVLFNLPAVLKGTENSETIYICEGEKDCELLISLGLIATTNPMGAGKWKESYSATLIGADVVILPDNDEVGRKHSDQVAKSLQGKANSIKILQLPGVPEKGDVSDWLKHDGNTVMLNKLSQETPERRITDILGKWPDPEDLNICLEPVEALPISLLPEPFQEWVHDIAHRLQVQPDMVAVSVMLVAGAVIGSGCGIRPKKKDDWLVIPNLWGAVVGDPGTLKTTALSEALNPIKMLENEAKEKYDSEHLFHEAEIEAYNAKKDGIKAQMKTAAKKGAQDTIETLKDEFSQLEKPESPLWKRYKTNDSTIEKMGELLAFNQRGILLFRDEMIGLMKGWDREGHEADRAFYLEAWNGFGSTTSDRIGRGTVHVDNLCISILGGIQPAKLLGYLYQASSAFENDGLIQRMQLMVYPDKLKDWKLIDEAPKAEAKERASRVIKTMAEMNFTDYGAHDDTIPYFQFDEEAQKLFYKWLTELQCKLSLDENPVMIEHLTKYRSLMPSLALIDHLVTTADKGKEGPITINSARKAAGWCDYLEGHARRIYGMLGKIGQRAALELSKKIKAKKLQDGFSIRDIYRNGWYLLSDKRAVESACMELEDAGWLKGEYLKDGRTKKVFYINPKIYLK